MLHIRAALITLGVVAVVSLSACAVGSTIVPDESAKARLDYENTQIILPLSEYRFTSSQSLIVNKAITLAYTPCLARYGFIPEDLNYPGKSEDRPYGLWNVENAKKYGSGLEGDNPNPEPMIIFADNAPPTTEQVAYNKCEAELEPFLRSIDSYTGDENPEMSMYYTAWSEAAAAMTHDPRWQTHRDGWRTCLRENGLEPNEDFNTVTSKQAYAPRDLTRPQTPAELENDIRIATIEATCDQQTQKTQRLSDLEAAYQMPVVRKYQAALTAEKEMNAEYVLRAEEYVASHG